MDVLRCGSCGRLMGKNTLTKDNTPKSLDGQLTPPDPVSIHADSDDCPTLEAEIVYNEGVSSYKVAVE